MVELLDQSNNCEVSKQDFLPNVKLTICLHVGVVCIMTWLKMPCCLIVFMCEITLYNHSFEQYEFCLALILNCGILGKPCTDFYINYKVKC
jgi:hypothetical protein